MDVPLVVGDGLAEAVGVMLGVVTAGVVDGALDVVAAGCVGVTLGVGEAVLQPTIKKLAISINAIKTKMGLFTLFLLIIFYFLDRSELSQFKIILF